MSPNNLTENSRLEISKRAAPNHSEEEPGGPCCDGCEVRPLVRRTEDAPLNNLCLWVIARPGACLTLRHVQCRAEHLIDTDVLRYTLEHRFTVAPCDTLPECHLSPFLHPNTYFVDNVVGVGWERGTGHLVQHGVPVGNGDARHVPQHSVLPSGCLRPKPGVCSWLVKRAVHPGNG